LKAENGVRYTVPQTIDVENMRDSVTVRFRVADIYHDRAIAVYYGDKKVMSRKKRVLAPGEMEQVLLKKDSFKDYPYITEITIRTEEA
jgi:ABC-type hemin transport system ATPase subunit